jgi:hypothetical protein
MPLGKGLIMRSIATARMVAAALATCLLATPAQAQGGCWSETEAAAAAVRNLQNRLLVGTQLCATRGHDISGNYNRFIRANWQTLQAANGVLRARFQANHGSAGEDHYDAFVTRQVNRFGGMPSGDGMCDATAQAAEQGTVAAGRVQALLRLAERMIADPELPGRRCGLVLASAAADQARNPPLATAVTEAQAEPRRETIREDATADEWLPTDARAPRSRNEQQQAEERSEDADMRDDPNVVDVEALAERVRAMRFGRPRGSD